MDIRGLRCALCDLTPAAFDPGCVLVVIQGRWAGVMSGNVFNPVPLFHTLLSIIVCCQVVNGFLIIVFTGMDRMDRMFAGWVGKANK